MGRIRGYSRRNRPGIILKCGGHSPPYELELAPLAPPAVTLVAASGLKTPAELRRYQQAGIQAFLIGETLVTAPDPGEKLREFARIEVGGGV